MQKFGLLVPYIRNFKKFMLIMKLCSLILLISLATASAKSSYSQNTRFTLDLEHVTVKQLFDKIEENSEFIFVYYDNIVDLTKEVSVSSNNETIEEILEKVFKSSENTFKVFDRQIVIAKKDGSTTKASALASQQPQKKEISGTVKDSKGLPIPGVTVVVKGTTTGTITDGDGKFTLSAPLGVKAVAFSFIGMKPQEIILGSKVLINVVMLEETYGLDEVVAVGYGAMKKSDITGAISSVKGKDLTLLPVQQVGQALQGQVSGVMVINPSGAPGGEPIIRIRGMNSINGGNEALIVIDGLQGGTLTSVNPNDVESIEILKDASATAIYGSQGANGVVLITTKKGKKGKPTVEYSLSMSNQTVRHRMDLMNAGDYAKTVNMERATQDASGTPPPVFTDAQIAAFYRSGGTDWQSVIFKPAPLQNHQLTVSGATDNMNYLVSAGYIDQQGLVVNSEYKRYSLRANFGADISKVVHFDLYYSGAIENGNIITVGDNVAWLGSPLNSVLVFAPTISPYDANGNYSHTSVGYGATDSWNPLSGAIEPKIANSNVQNNINTNLTFKILKGLTFKIVGGAYISNVKNKSYYDGQTSQGLASAIGVGYATYINSLYYNLENSNILTYDRLFGAKHHLVVTGVAENQYSKSQATNLIAQGFAVDVTGANALGGASSVSGSSPLSERVLRSYLGRVNYSYADRYLATVSYRADASSVFGSKHKWGYFPSMSVAWRASQESFIKGLNIFSDLKLRGSLGVTGNQGISPYQTLANMTNSWSGNNYGNANYPYNGGPQTGNSSVGMIQANSANPNLKWESTRQSNVGIDFSIFKGRLTATAEYYNKLTSDLLLGKAIPTYSGFQTLLSNVGSIENKGYEFTMGGDPFVGKFKWNTNFNISFNKNIIKNLGDKTEMDFTATNGGYDVSGGFMQLRVGGSFGDMYGYKTLGTWKTNEAAQAAVFGAIPGMMHWDDPNKDGKIDVNDIVKIGHSLPKFTLGWNNRFSYGNFDLAVFITGSEGNQVFNMGRIRIESQYEGTSKALLNSWTPTHQTDIPAYIKASTWATYPNLVSTNTISNSSDAQRISRWVEDASYIRVKNITLGYTLPGSLTERYGILKFKAFVSATNFLTATKYTGFDPEVSSFNGNDAQLGVDYNNYPTAKTMTFGINLTF